MSEGSYDVINDRGKIHHHRNRLLEVSRPTDWLTTRLALKWYDRFCSFGITEIWRRAKKSQEQPLSQSSESRKAILRKTKYHFNLINYEPEDYFEQPTTSNYIERYYNPKPIPCPPTKNEQKRSALPTNKRCWKHSKTRTPFCWMSDRKKKSPNSEKQRGSIGDIPNAPLWLAKPCHLSRNPSYRTKMVREKLVVCPRIWLKERKNLYSDYYVCFYFILFFSHNCIVLCLWTTGCKSSSNFAGKRIQKGLECRGVEWSPWFLEGIMIVWQLCNCSQDDSVAWWISYMEGIYIYITQLHADELSNEQNLDFRPLRWMNEWMNE